MVALLEREKSGKGQWVKSSLLQAQLFMLDFQAARWLMRGEVAKQAGNNHPTSIPTGVYKTRDGYMNLAVTGMKIWIRMCEAIGAPQLATHADYATGALRSKNRDALHEVLEAYFVKQRHTTLDRSVEQGRRARAARSTRSTRRSPIRRCKASAWCRSSATFRTSASR